MRSILPISLLALTLLGDGCTTSRRATSVERPDFKKYFSEAGVTGTFVLYDPAARRYLVHNPDRARERFIPASTFKVLNSLVALETGVVADTTTVFEWDGVERSIPQWNRDHTLATAFESSTVWVYQELSRRIGAVRMQDHVGRAGYGNANIGGGIDQFWLSGDLRISATEQVNFLQRLHERRLPFSERTVDLVEGIMVEGRGPDHVLHGKSGWADGIPADIGWYVGYVVRDDRTYYFALNIDIERAKQGAARRGIARAILVDLGLL
ncbi:MAG: class D beta-lactamase [Rhodothermales bacterium]|nr:class D beta-lactamase [Rhodothermales bacterium]